MGYMLISLDFELMWGVRDKRSIESYGSNILGAREVIPGILNLFAENGIHCTWATVGLLFGNKKEDIRPFLPLKDPHYTDKNLSLHPYYDDIDNNDSKYFFAAPIIELIKKTPMQEVGSHTFSHYYCLEDGQTEEDFEEDIRAAMKIANKYGVELKSLVFPRNQVNNDYCNVLIRNGITAFRGNEENWWYKKSRSSGISLIKRTLRFFDAYVNLSGHNCYSADDSSATPGLFNFRASRFFRPYSHRLRLLEGLKMMRIKSQMRYAAKHDLIFHLWWHPHNFGANIARNMGNLRVITDYYHFLNKKYGFISRNMNELSMELGVKYTRS